jgi:DNA invertase Pin-like site-specific DNA recombinase
MIYGYGRVSMKAQDLIGPTAQLKAAGCEKVFREKITGTTRRPSAAKKADGRPHPWRRQVRIFEDDGLGGPSA